MSEAMVKPAPRKLTPKRRTHSPKCPPSPDDELRKILQMFGNDRPYSILNFDGRQWIIHLSGDIKHTIVKWDGEKPTMEFID